MEIELQSEVRWRFLTAPHERGGYGQRTCWKSRALLLHAANYFGALRFIASGKTQRAALKRL
jgi:hypothetical protein